MSENINTAEYWNDRFEYDWEKMLGDEQTFFFANIAVELMPNWFVEEIRKKKLSICDFGCAIGQAVDYLHGYFNTSVSGADFSESAISKARKVYSQYEFWKTDIVSEYNPEMKYDVGYISNVLEHIENPWAAAQNVAQYLKKYLVILIPFREAMENEEHCNKFDLDSIPLYIADFRIVYAAYKDCALVQDTLYNDKQLLLIYSSENTVVQSLKLKELVQSFEHDRRKEEQHHIAGLLNQVSWLSEEKDRLNQIISDKDSILAEVDSKLNELQGESNKYLNEIIELNRIVDDKNKIIAEADGKLNELQGKTNEYLNKIIEVNRIVDEKNEVIAKADSRLNALQEKSNKYLGEIAELNQIVDDKNAIIVEADNKLNDLQEKSNEYLSKITELNHMVDDKNVIIAEAGNKLSDLQEKSNSYLEEIVELNQIVDDKNKIIVESDNRLNACYETDKILRREHAEEIEKLEIQMQQYVLDADYMKNMIYGFQIERERMKKTLSWRLTKPLRYAGHWVKCIQQMLADHKILYAKIRNSAFYKKYLKKFVPQKWKNELMNRYFQTPEATYIFENNDQERQVLDCLKDFEESLKEDDRLILVFSGVKYIDSEGQRNIRLIHEAKKMGRKIIFAYWRWGIDEELEASEENMVKIPIDILSKKQVYFFENLFRNVKDKCLLIEFPHPYVTQIIEIANSFGWKTIYDVIDDWEEFSKCGQAGWYRKEVERRVANIVDINIATAYGLRNKVAKDIVEDKPYYIITNGVDPDRVKRTGRDPEYNFIKGKLQIGYFGHLTDAWFDWEMLKNIAKDQHEWTFHIIGYGAPENLELPDNIVLYGKKPPEELAKFAAYWDVAIIPFINNELTRGVNPIKVFEYLQLRLPVVASDMPEIANYPYVTLAVGKENFQQAIKDAAEVTLDDSVVDEFIEANTWGNKCKELLEIISNIEKL